MKRLRVSEYRTLAQICISIAQVYFGATLAAVVLPLDAGKTLVVTLQLGSAIGYWYLSLIFANKGKA